MEDIRHVRTDMEMKMLGVKDICNNELERAKEEYKYMKQDLTDKYVLSCQLLIILFSNLFF